MQSLTCLSLTALCCGAALGLPAVAVPVEPATTRTPLAVASLGAPSQALPLSLPPGLMTLRQTSRRLLISGDPIWELRLAIPGQRERSFSALVGRAERQGGDRHSLGSQAPLPIGHYRVEEIVALAEAKGLSAELGRELWIGLQPQFVTARRALGIHLDPSAGLLRESGTDGCIGLIDRQELRLLGELLQRSGTTSLQVLN